MQNRILKRGLAFLLAGGMCLSGLGGLPVLAEDDLPPEAASSEPVPLSDDGSTVAAIDFGNVSSLDASELGGWTVSGGSGTADLVQDAEQGQVLKLSRTADGSETVLSYDSLGIQESATRYVTVEAEMMLASEGYAHQLSVPYIFDSNGATAYSLFTNESLDTFQSHVNGKNATAAGSIHADSWQTVRMNIDLGSDTFTVYVDGIATLRDAAARTVTDNLSQIKFYSDSWNRGTVYIKSVTVTAGNEAPNKPHTAAATYYVSNNGDDSADGKSPETAWKTIARVNQETFVPGDQILFERGGSWENTSLQPMGSGTADAYIKIGSYGEGALPRIAANGKQADAIYLYNQQYWEICDLDISNTVEGFTMTAGDTNPTGNVVDRVNEQGEKLGDYRGIHIAGRDVASLQGFYIHDVRIHDVTGVVSWIGNTGLGDAGIHNNYGYDASKRTGGILIESLAPTNNTPTVFNNIKIENNEIVNNSFGGITIKQYNNGKNQNNGTGWANRNSAGGAPDYYDSNWHPHTNILISGNYINQGASAYACNGIYLCGVKDSVVEKNTLEHIGTCGIELFFADNVAVQYNEISDVRVKGGGADSNAIDPDWRATNILIQYNYIHDCGEGFLLCGMSFNSGIIRYNLLQDCLYSYVHYSMGSGSFQFYNNIFYRSKDGNGTSNFDPWGGGSASYVNNIFYDGKGSGFGYSGGSSFSYYNNAYYGGNPCGKDTNPIVLTEDPFVGSAPSMSRKGTADTGALLEATGLTPKADSPLIAAGAVVDATGTSLTEGLFEAGSKYNFTSLRENYGDIVPIAPTAYPQFDGMDAEATLASGYTQVEASTEAPTIGLFEVSLPEDAVYLRGTVSDGVSTYAGAKVTVSVNGETVETVTGDAGSYSITEGLTAGDATITVSMEGREDHTQAATLASGKVNVVDITVPMLPMPDDYEETLISENFDSGSSEVFQFASGTSFTNGELVITQGMGNYSSAVSSFDENVASRTAVDFSFDYRYENSCNKAGFQFRDDEGNLLFAMCTSTSKGEMRYSTTADPMTSDDQAGWDNNAVHPVWSHIASDARKTYVVRVHADFEAGTVSYQIKDKATDQILVQELDVPTAAKNLAKMYICSWYDSRPQYIDNFVLTAAAPEPTVDKASLQMLCDACDALDETDYTADSWTALQTALAEAKAVLADETAAQSDVDRVLDELQEKYDNLIPAAREGYTVSLSGGGQAAVNGRTEVTLSIASADKSTYNAFDVTLNYDPEVLAFDSLSDTALKAEDSNGALRIYTYGEERKMGDVVRVKFTVLSETEGSDVTIAAAKADQSDNAVEYDAPDAAIGVKSVTVATSGYAVELGENLSGPATVMPGEDYTFTVNDAGHYTYQITVLVDGTDVSSHLVDNGDGSYTLPGEFVTGSLTITAERTARSYSVTFTGNGAADATGDSTATYGKDYTFTVAKQDGYAYTVTATIGGTAYTGLAAEGDTYTIRGVDITGDITVTVEKETVPGEMVSVTFTGNAVGDAAGASTTEKGKDYTFTVTEQSGYTYTVSAVSGEQTATVTKQEDGSYLIPGKDVQDDLTITVNKESVVSYEVTVSEYVKLDGSSVFLVKCAGTLPQGQVPVYDGNTMFYSQVYEAYVWLTVETDSFDASAARAKIELTNGTAEELAPTADVNTTDTVDINDAQLVYDLYNAKYADFEHVSMQKFLAADQNADGVLTVQDATAVVRTMLAGE